MSGNNNGTQVTFCGLGMMGSVLANKLAATNCQLTLWNRTAIKFDLMSMDGARFEADLCVATQDADLIIICVTDGAASQELVEIIAQTINMPNKSLLVLSTTTYAQAKALSDTVSRRGGEYLSGSVLGYPANVADGDCTIVTSGSRSAFDKHEVLLRHLGGRIEFLSENCGANCIFDRAVYAAHYGAVVAFIAGATMAKTAGLDMDLYTREATSGQLDFALYADQIKNENYLTDEATLAIEADAYADVPNIMQDLDLDSALARETVGLFDRALQQGYDELSIAALARVFRGSNS